MLIHLLDGSAYSAESFHEIYWMLTKLSGDATYTVDPVAGSCTCPSAKYREGVCKHVLALREVLLKCNPTR